MSFAFGGFPVPTIYLSKLHENLVAPIYSRSAKREKFQYQNLCGIL